MPEHGQEDRLRALREEFWTLLVERPDAENLLMAAFRAGYYCAVSKFSGQQK